MSKNIIKEWNRLAFGSNNGKALLKESSEDASPLAPLRDMGFYFAGIDTVIMGDLNHISEKKYPVEYPCDDPWEQGPFNVEISIENDGTFRIHNHTSIDDRFCTGYMPKRDERFNSLQEVMDKVSEMLQCYEEFMDAYVEINAADGVVDEFYRYIDDKHPVSQRLMKK
jgi:hypothetical protein